MEEVYFPKQGGAERIQRKENALAGAFDPLSSQDAYFPETGMLYGVTEQKLEKPPLVDILKSETTAAYVRWFAPHSSLGLGSEGHVCALR